MFKRLFLLAVLAGTFILATPNIASAHNVGGVSATDYKSSLDSVTPSIPGLTMTDGELGDRMQLVNKTKTEVTVLGYSGEPYLRVGPAGAFVNQNSPDYYVNKSLYGGDYVPPNASATATPDWVKQSAANSVTWHDHRVHWVSSVVPADVKSDPSHSHVVVPEWTIKLQYGSQPITATGHVTWVPASSSIPWYSIAVVTFGLSLFLCVRRARLTSIVLLILIVVDVVHTLGLSLDVVGTTTQRIERVATTVLPSAVAWIIGVVGARRLWRGNADGPWYGLFAACLIGALGGVSDLESLRRSQTPFVWGAVLDKVCVSISLGVGVGLAVGMIWLLRLQIKQALANPPVNPQFDEVTD